MKRAIALILLAVTVLSLAACGGPKEVDMSTAIIGKWQNEAGKVMEFKADGTGTCILSAGERSCTWKFDEAHGSRYEIIYSTSGAYADIELTNSGLVLTFEGITYKKIG